MKNVIFKYSKYNNIKFINIKAFLAKLKYSKYVPISVIKNTKLNINNEDDYHTIQSIIHSFNGSIYFNEKNGKFYFK